MQLLYSDIPPVEFDVARQMTITNCFTDQMSKADCVEIAVGYVSVASLSELDALVEKYKIRKICLVAGMYYIDGMPESTYHAAVKLNKKWRESGTGEIRLVDSIKYHGKVYCFYKNGDPYSAIIGSANLGSIKLDASNRRQYEVSVLITEKKETKEAAVHVESIKAHSVNIAEISSDKMENFLIREKNAALNGIDKVRQVPQADVEIYRQSEPLFSFNLPLKVPSEADKYMDDGRHFTKSNINVCYASPRSATKPRDWYETQLTVSSDIYRQTGYPNRNEPFFVVTDDGYRFMAHTTSDNNKQFSAVGDELIMGRWLKGRLATAGLVTPVNNTRDDVERRGMITKEILNEYGRNCLLFNKTDKKALDDDGNALDIWYLSFIRESSNN